MRISLRVPFDIHKIPDQPGIYIMYGASEEVLYVGKANSLRDRLRSYFLQRRLAKRIARLVLSASELELILTRTEVQALLLEQTYINRLQPKFNVLLKDDRAYPYLFLTHEQHPRLLLHYRRKNLSGEYFGPFTERRTVRKILRFLQKTFGLRVCSEHQYRNRKHPCLQHQLGFCSAPCISEICNNEQYGEQIKKVRLFLLGKSDQLLQELSAEMALASKQRRFEDALVKRDQIRALRHLLIPQAVQNLEEEEDVVCCIEYLGVIAVHVLCVRGGKITHSRSHFPTVPTGYTRNQAGEAFLNQFYLASSLGRPCPNRILLNFHYPERQPLQLSLQERYSRQVTITEKATGRSKLLIDLAERNARQAACNELAHHEQYRFRWDDLGNWFGRPIRRIECWDVSHLQGEGTIAACVVFESTGPIRAAYRRYLIQDENTGNDCAALRKGFSRRYEKLIRNQSHAEAWPELILVDGGKGQLTELQRCFARISETPSNEPAPLLVGISKGAERRPGSERIWVGHPPTCLSLPSDAPAHYMLRYCRDEAHRHAIGGQRRLLLKNRQGKALEKIPQIGPKRRQLLLAQFGGLKGLEKADVSALASVPGISKVLAGEIYRAFHKHEYSI